MIFSLEPESYKTASPSLRSRVNQTNLERACVGLTPEVLWGLELKCGLQ
jgi:hypothetical protein